MRWEPRFSQLRSLRDLYQRKHQGLFTFSRMNEITRTKYLLTDGWNDGSAIKCHSWHSRHCRREWCSNGEREMALRLEESFGPRRAAVTFAAKFDLYA